MTRDKFIELRTKLLEEEDFITKTKGKDYTKSSEDCLANFKEGVMLGLTPLQTAGMFAKKHIDAIYNYIKTNGQSESEPLRERIKDARNYLIFILALVEDDQHNKRLKDGKNKIQPPIHDLSYIEEKHQG